LQPEPITPNLLPSKIPKNACDVIESISYKGPSVKILQETDAIVIEELYRSDHYQKIGQAFVVFLTCKTVGVMGDSRTYENVASVRCIETTDFMTADFYHMT